MHERRPLAAISDDELLRGLAELLRRSRRVESDLVAHIAEVDSRRLYAREAAPSMFAYCTEVLHLSEAEAYLRIAVARASREHPLLLEMLADGRLHLAGIARLLPHLTLENRDTLLARATHKSRREIEEMVAEMAPRPDVPAATRRLPEARVLRAPSVAGGSGEAGPGMPAGTGVPAGVDIAERLEEGIAAAVGMPQLCPDRVGAAASTLGPGGNGSSLAPVPVLGLREAVDSPVIAHAPTVDQFATPAVSVHAPQIQPLGAARYKVQFTASAELRDKLERLRALMRSQVPEGDLAAIIEQAVSEKLARLESRRFAKTSSPRKGRRPGESGASPTQQISAAPTRQIPAAVRRAVYERDGGQCRFVDESGRRCSERERLEYHHRHPFGVGGDHSLTNIRLMCRAHNLYLAEHDYGRQVMARYRHSARPVAARALVQSAR